MEISNSHYIQQFIFNLSFWKRVLLCCLIIGSTVAISLTDIANTLMYLLCIGILIYKRQWPKPNLLAISIIVFFALNLVSGILNPYEKGSLTALDANLRFFLPFALAMLWEEDQHNNYLKLFLFWLVFISIYGIIQHYTGADWFRSAARQSPTPYKHPCYSLFGTTQIFHAKGNYTHHLTYGGVLLLSFPIFASLSFCKALSLRLRGIYAVGVLCILVGIVMSLGRSIWIGSGVAILLLSLRLPKKWLMIICCGFSLVVGILLVRYTYEAPKLDQPVSGVELIWQRLASGFVLEYNKDRLLLWESAWDAIEDHFWFGIGLKNDAKVMPKYRAPIVERTGHPFFNFAGAGVHNIYLQTWLNLGLFGLLGYLSFLIIFLVYSIRVLRQAAEKINPDNINLAAPGSLIDSPWQALLWGCVASIGGYMVAGSFENNFRDAEVQSMLFIVMGLGLVAWRNIKKKS